MSKTGVRTGRKPGDDDEVVVLEERTRLLIARGRETAARALIELAESDGHDEVKRKACVDLLKMQPDPEATGASPGPNPVASAEILLALRQSLESLGRGRDAPGGGERAS